MWTMKSSGRIYVKGIQECVDKAELMLKNHEMRMQFSEIKNMQTMSEKVSEHVSRLVSLKDSFALIWAVGIRSCDARGFDHANSLLSCYLVEKISSEEIKVVKPVLDGFY